ncbi:uncharacterized protein TrAFT101_011074 [Trichoderma asperellum]|uniref:uncharacterized protein n=1 Tax=Trichoderma asperellum TaxID=101201 RepID=UPI003324B991|nr:hypothetical protein TrAFT101_011074 [Trichoderma asperellum]
MAANYEYDKIDLDGPGFRLVRLHQGDGGDLSCDLFQAVLHQHDELIPYEALSYTWGPTGGHHSIVVNDQRMGITANLHLALMNLRYPHSDRILWVDAVCIDQSNVKERNHQVAHMSDIYKQAGRVIFFLGNATFTTDAFMHCMQLVQQECSKHAYRSWTRDDIRWKKIWAAVQEKTQGFDDVPCQGFKSLLSRSWFRRVWILQEVANAKAAVVCCGNREIPANTFAIAPIIFGVKPSVHCQSVIDIMPGPWRKSSWWSEKPCLYTLFLRFGETEASEPRDLIYALKAIAADSDSNSPILTPDYEKTERRLVCDVVGFLLGFKSDKGLLSSSVNTTIKDVIKNLEKVKNHWIWEAVKTADFECLEGILRAPGVEIPEGTISLVAEYDMTGEMMNLLLAHRNKESEVAVATFLNAVEIGTVPAIAVLEDYISSQTAIPTFSEKLLAAARNQRQGASLMERFLPNIPKLDDYTRIAEAAAANKAQAIKIIQQLIQRNCRIILTHQLHKNALMSGCYKDVLELFVKYPLSHDQMVDGVAMNGVNEQPDSANSARAFFRSQAKFLIRHAFFDHQLFAMFKLSGQQLESHGYIFLEEFFICAAEVFAESTAELLSQQREQFSSALTMHWILEDSGFQIHVTKDAVQAAIDGKFGSQIFRFLKEAREFVIDFEAALGVVKLGNIPSVEKILLYQGGLFRRNASIVGAFQEWYIYSDKYIDKSKQQKYNWLIHAIYCECYEASQLLLSFGADTEQKDFDGQTALTATESHRIAALLLSYGANIDARGSCRRTPVHWAVSRKNYHLAELLLVCGADVNTTDHFGETPLDVAAQFGNDTSLFRMLREYGAYKMTTSSSSKLIETILQEPTPESPVPISATVQGLMEEFGLVAKPHCWANFELSPKDRCTGQKRRRSLMH